MRRLRIRVPPPRQLSGNERVWFMLLVLETGDGTGSVVRGFKSHFPDEMVIVAQLEECLTVNQVVTGSNPVFHPKIRDNLIYHAIT